MKLLNCWPRTVTTEIDIGNSQHVDIVKYMKLYLVF